MRPLVLCAAVLATLGALTPAAAGAPADTDRIAGWVYTGMDGDIGGATVVIRDAFGRKVGGDARTAGNGDFVIRARHLTRRQLRRVTVTARGGRVGGRPLGTPLVAMLRGWEVEEPIHVNLVTTAVAYHYRRHPAGGLRGAERRVRHAMRLRRGAHLGTHVRYSTRHAHPDKIASHARRLGGYRAWLRYIHRHARHGTRAKRYAGERVRARAAQGGAAAGMFLFNASRSDCSNSGAGTAGQAAGWGLATIAKANGFGPWGDKASSYATSKDNSCLILGQLAQIVGLLRDIQSRLIDMDQRLSAIESQLSAINANSWAQFYSTNAARFNGLRGALGTGSGPLIKLFQRLEIWQDTANHTISKDSDDFDEFLDSIYQTLLRPTDNGAQVYDNLTAALSPQSSGGIGIYEAAWRMIRSRGERFVTQSQINDFRVIRDYWSQLTTAALALVTEYWHARGTDFKSISGRDGKPRSNEEIADAIHTYFRAGAQVPQIDDLPGCQGLPASAPPCGDRDAAAYDPTPRYFDWDPDSQTLRDGLTMLWRDYCGWKWADPGDTERTDVTVSGTTCTTGRYIATFEDDLANSELGYPGCLKRSAIVSLPHGGDGWLPATKEAWDTLMAQHEGGTSLWAWLRSASPTWWLPVLGGSSATISTSTPIAYFLHADTSGCPYGRASRPPNETGSWYRTTGDRHFTISLYHLAASSADNWLCTTGSEVNSRNYTCPFHDPQRLAVSMVVRPKSAGEHYVPWVPDPDDIAAGNPPASLKQYPAFADAAATRGGRGDPGVP